MWSFVYNNLMQLFPELDDSFFAEEENGSSSEKTPPEAQPETSVNLNTDAAYKEALQAAEALNQNISLILSEKTASKDNPSTQTKTVKQTYRINDTDMSREDFIKYVQSLEKQMVYNYQFVDNVLDKINLKLLTDHPKRKDLDWQTKVEDRDRKRQLQRNERKLELLREELRKQMLKSHKKV